MTVPVDSECKVVYLLAESRKLLNQGRPEPDLFALRLHCHWALHVDLSHPSTTRRFLSLVDEFAASILCGSKRPEREREALRELAHLETFRREFERFLSSYGLPTGICDNEGEWREFLKYYAGVIEDGSIACEGEGRGLGLVKKVVFSKGRPATTPGGSLPFDLQWEILLTSGKTLTVQVNSTASAAGQATIYGATLR